MDTMARGPSPSVSQHGRSKGRWERHARSARVQAPPAPGFVIPSSRAPLDPPIWSAATTAQPVAMAATVQRRETVDRRLARRAGTGLTVALGMFFALELAGALLAWLDAEIRTPGQGDTIVGYAVCCALVVPALALRGRWRVVPTAVAALAGAAVPLLLARDLLGMLGAADLWIGQSMTLHVVFPLLIGAAAIVAQFLGGRRQPHRRNEPSTNRWETR